MNKQEIIRFANENKVCFLATADGNQPTVRALAFWFANDEGFWFVTGTYQKFYQQLNHNPKTEVCFLRQEGTVSTMVRIRGSVVFCDDLQMKEKAVTDRPFLKAMGLDADSPALVVFRIQHGEATCWSNQQKDSSQPPLRF